MQESYLEKNLGQIAKYNKELADKILAHQDIKGNFEFLTTKCDDVNLVLDTVPLHDEIDPIEEADKIWRETKYKDENVLHVLYGLGLGYVFKKFASSIKGKLIIYEPNLDVLRITLEVVDFSAELSQPNVKLVHDKFNLKSTAEKIYQKNDEMTLSFMNSYRKLYSQDIIEFSEELKVIRSLFSTGYTELARKSEIWARSSIKNLCRIFYNNELDALRGRFKDKTAIIVSAGPSLNKSIKYIKKHRSEVLVFCVNVALKTLLHYGVKPDFVCIIETGGCAPSLEGVDVSDLRFIVPPEVNPVIYEKDLGEVFNYYSENIFTSDWIQQFTNISCLDYLNRGTVSIATMWSAYMMGCNPIILTGQDLAYSGGKCYAGNATFDLEYKYDLETKKYSVRPADYGRYIEQASLALKSSDMEYVKSKVDEDFKKRSENIVSVKGQNGEDLPTSPGYSLFIKHFEELIPMIKDTKLYNCSEGGAQIDGYDNQSIEKLLEEILASRQQIYPNKVLKEALASYSKPYSKESFVFEIDKNISELQECKSIAEKAISNLKKFNNQYKRRKVLSDDLAVLLQKVQGFYNKTITEYFAKNRLIMAIFYKFYLSVEDVLQDSTEGEERINKIVNKFKHYFEVVYKYSDEFSDLLREQKEKIVNESCCSKS